MEQKYSVEVLEIINETALAYCDQIAQMPYYKTYKFAAGCNMPVEVYNNMLYKICDNKILEGDILIAVCSPDGTKGLVFGPNGIFYKKDIISNSIYVGYADCKEISSFPGLENDRNFSQDVIKRMIYSIGEAVRIGTNREKSAIANFRNKFKNGKDYFAEGKEELDAINECIMSFYDADYSARYQKLGIFKISEKKKLSNEWSEHFRKVKRLINAHNKDGSVDGIKYKVINEAIRYALSTKYFLTENFNEQYICFDQRKIKTKTLQLISNHKRSLEYGFMRDTPEDYFVAFVDLSDGDCKEGIVFRSSSMLIKYRKMAHASVSRSEFTDILFQCIDCYVGFGTSDIGLKIDPRKLNYVLDKIHKITEGNY